MLGINGSVHWCLCMQIDKHSHIQSIRGSSSLKAVPHILLSLPSLLPSPSLSLFLSLSPSTSASMQKTLMSLWGFATAHFHGKFSVLCLRHHCQVLILHRDDSQSKAETQMSLCRRTPLDEGKRVFIQYLKKKKGMDSHWSASVGVSNSGLVGRLWDRRGKSFYRLWEMPWRL